MTSEETRGSQFYYVSSDERKVTLTFRHATLLSAYNEANRLATKENKPFFILGTICRVVPKVIIAEVQDMRVYQGDKKDEWTIS